MKLLKSEISFLSSMIKQCHEKYEDVYDSKVKNIGNIKIKYPKKVQMDDLLPIKEEYTYSEFDSLCDMIKNIDKLLKYKLYEEMISIRKRLFYLDDYQMKWLMSHIDLYDNDTICDTLQYYNFVKQEYKLIKDKKSNLSKSNRDELYYLINKSFMMAYEEKLMFI